MADGTALFSPCRLRPAVDRATVKVVDLFCGAGGFSTGAARALRSLGLRMELTGVNHWPVAIETNRLNHPAHAHRIHCADLEVVRPSGVVPEGVVDLLLAAPSCVFHSRARGGKPVHDQQRMDPWHVVRWCTDLRVRCLLVENVEEYVHWGPCDPHTGQPIKARRGEYFRAWCNALRAIGFELEWRLICTADYGDPTERRRFFLIARSDGGRLDFPLATHCRRTATGPTGALPVWRGGSEIVDPQVQGRSIFGRSKPLSPKTLQRIRAGVVREAWPAPYLDAIDALLAGRPPVLDVPAELVETFAALIQHARPGLIMSTASGGAARPVTSPLPTIVGGGNGARPHYIHPVAAAHSSLRRYRIDIHHRMLSWREIARAMSFDDEGEIYAFAGTGAEITKQIGNAVPTRTAGALVRQLMLDFAAS